MVRQRFGAEGRTVEVVGQARAVVAEAVGTLGLDALADQAALITSELVTNALFHGQGIVEIRVEPVDSGIRISVEDRTRVPPVLALANTEAMTGRGLLLISSMSSRLGADVTETGKVVWAEVVPGHVTSPLTEEQLLDLWDDVRWEERVPAAGARHRIVLGEVPTDLLVAAKTHVDNLVRELTLTATGATTGATAPLPPPLAALVDSVVFGFAEARQAIKRQALEGARRGDDHVRLELSLPPEAADAGEKYLDALDEADAYSRAARLLTLETPPQHRLFRQWYVGELVRQLRAVAHGEAPPLSETFEQRLLREIDTVAEAQQVSERGARLYEVAAALSRAVTPEDVAAAVLMEGVEALGASGGGVLLATEPGTLQVPGTIGYDESVVAQLRTESPDAELPAAVALRTGDAVWLESLEEVELRFPELRALEPDAVSLCAVPLVLAGRRLGALRFSFPAARLFDDHERRFVVALADQTAQALDRTLLHAQRLDTSVRLQRGLLPGRIPDVPGLEIAGIHHPLGHGMELGGDFYDVWPLSGGRFGFAIGDSAGTGPEAAALSAMVRFTLRALTVAGMDIVAALERLNETMLDAEADADAEVGLGGQRFCTSILGIITPGQRPQISLASGGHPYPLLRRAGHATEEVLLGGSLLGVLPDPEFTTRRVDLGPGDLLVLVTDGATEARRDGVMFGVEGVRDTIDSVGPDAHAADVAAAVETAVVEHTGGELNDDTAALVLRGT
jgi:serine phosphatase RsbU (regulator of sigma subunit)/anti-sigma regulatory factor (Ser/Thr protein kinase)